MADRMSLQVLEKGAVIVAKRISEGGELILPQAKTAKNGPPGLSHDYESNKRSHVCGLGPMGEFITIESLGSKKEEHHVVKLIPPFKGPSVFNPQKPSSSFIYDTHVVKVSSLQPNKDAPQPSQRVTKPLKKLSPPNARKQMNYQPICSEMFKDLESSRKMLKTANQYEKRRKLVRSATLANDLSTLPLYALSVKWRLSPNLPCYTIEGVHAVLSRYGAIVSLGQLNPNSAIVVFDNIDVASSVVSCGNVGFVNCPLICTWWHPRMYIERFAKENQKPPKVAESLSQESLYQREFRLLQERLMACFRIRGQNLSYDHTNFIP